MSRRWDLSHMAKAVTYLSQSMLYREARSVAESSEGPTASKRDRTGRDDSFGTTLQRHVWRYCFFLSCSNIPSAHA